MLAVLKLILNIYTIFIKKAKYARGTKRRVWKVSGRALRLCLWPGHRLGSLRSHFVLQIHQSVAAPRLQHISHASLEFCNLNWQTTGGTEGGKWLAEQVQRRGRQTGLHRKHASSQAAAATATATAASTKVFCQRCCRCWGKLSPASLRLHKICVQKWFGCLNGSWALKMFWLDILLASSSMEECRSHLTVA